jgi:hypothetical protein
MKIAAAPCSFKCYNKENPTGSDSSKYSVASFSFSPEEGVASSAVSGDLYVGQISVSAEVSVKNLVGVFSGTVAFVFPARHRAFMLEGHATLAVNDTVTADASLMGFVGGLPVPASFVLTAEIVSSGQDVWDDYSQT